MPIPARVASRFLRAIAQSIDDVGEDVGIAIALLTNDIPSVLTLDSISEDEVYSMINPEEITYLAEYRDVKDIN